MRETPSPALLSRRRLLQIGGVGAMGLSLPRLLQAGAPRAGGGASGPERSCIFIVQYGGGSHIDSLDPRPDAPEEMRGPYKPIATSAPGIEISELLPRLAKHAHRFSIVPGPARTLGRMGNSLARLSV